MSAAPVSAAVPYRGPARTFLKVVMDECPFSKDVAKIAVAYLVRDGGHYYGPKEYAKDGVKVDQPLFTPQTAQRVANFVNLPCQLGQLEGREQDVSDCWTQVVLCPPSVTFSDGRVVNYCIDALQEIDPKLIDYFNPLLDHHKGVVQERPALLAMHLFVQKRGASPIEAAQFLKDLKEEGMIDVETDPKLLHILTCARVYNKTAKKPVLGRKDGLEGQMTYVWAAEGTKDGLAHSCVGNSAPGAMTVIVYDRVSSSIAAVVLQKFEDTRS